MRTNRAGKTGSGILMAVLLGVAVPAQAGEGPSLDERLAQLTRAESLTIEGKAYLRYWYDIQDGDAATEGDAEPHENTFEVWRFYFGVRARLLPWLSMRLTSDVGPEKKHETSEAGDHSHDPSVPEGTGVGMHAHEAPGESSYQFFLKYAWIEAKLVPGLILRAGIVDNPHNDFTDGIWGYRYVARNPGEGNGLWNSADLGAYLRYELPAGFGSVVAGVFNGAGYKNALDTDVTKDVFGQVVIAPLVPLGEALGRFQIAGLVQAQMTGDSKRERLLTWSGFAGYRDDWFMLGYLVMGRSNDMAQGGDFAGLGHSALARFDTPWKVGAFGRFTVWDADGLSRDDSGSDETVKGGAGTAGVADLPAVYEAVAGLSYSPAKLFSVAASTALTWSEEVDGGEDMETGVKALLSTEINF